MVKCSFCGNNIEQGTGKMFAFNTGDVKFYCSNKCEKNHLKLHRIPRKTKWTQEYERIKK